MPESQALASEEIDLPPTERGESPAHGFRGKGEGPTGSYPAALSIAISREAGARGATIAKRAGEKLGWQVFTQELLEYTAQEGSMGHQVLDQLPAPAAAWVEEQRQRLLMEQNVGVNPSVMALARTVLSLGAQGEVILLGRGAGAILPARSTLHVRLVSPLNERIAFMAQALRLTAEEAAEQVRNRDAQRAEFLATYFRSQGSDLYQYDLVINTSRLGEDRSAELIIQAAKIKMRK